MQKQKATWTYHWQFIKQCFWPQYTGQVQILLLFLL